MIKEPEKLLEQMNRSLSPETQDTLSDLCRYMRKNSMYWDHVSEESFDDIIWLEDNINR